MTSEASYCNTSKEAIQYGNVLELQRIIQQGGDINALDSKFKFSSLHWASHYGSLECMHWLLWHGAEINKQCKDGWTPSHIAAIRGRSSCLQALAANGADLNLVDSRGKTATHLAASHGNTKTLQEILRKGIGIEICDSTGWSAAHTAAYHGKVACLQLLSKWGCDMNTLDLNGNTLAHLAAGEGHTICLKFLLTTSRNLKALVKARNDQGDTPKDCAMQYYKKSCVDYLQEIEYDIDNPEVSENLSYPAHNSAYKGDLDYLCMVIETGIAKIDERDEKGSTPLHKAAGNGQLEVLKWLIEKGADARLLNEAGETCKDVAFRFGQLACAKLLGGQSDYEDDDQSADVNMTIDVNDIESDAKVRAERKLEELSEQLEIAKLNYRQLGGTLNEDLKKIEEQKEHTRIIRDLEHQLEYERVKREKLEEQVDQMRVHIHKLHLQLEDERSKIEQMNSNGETTSHVTDKKARKSVQKKSNYKSQQSGIFLVQKKSVNEKVNNDKHIVPKPPRTKKPNNIKQRRKNSLDSEVSRNSAVSVNSNRQKEVDERNLSLSSRLSNGTESVYGSVKSKHSSRNRKDSSDSNSSHDDKSIFQRLTDGVASLSTKYRKNSTESKKSSSSSKSDDEE